MKNMLFSEKVHVVKGLDPVANAFAGTVYTDVVNMKNYGKCTFLIVKGVGATGTTVVTVLASSDVDKTATTAIPFKYRVCTTGDTWGSLTAAEAAGFTTTAGSSQRYLIEVDNKALALTGYGYVVLCMVEATAAAVLGGVDIFLSEPRYTDEDLPTAIV